MIPEKEENERNTLDDLIFTEVEIQLKGYHNFINYFKDKFDGL